MVNITAGCLNGKEDIVARGYNKNERTTSRFARSFAEQFLRNTSINDVAWKKVALHKFHFKSFGA